MTDEAIIIPLAIGWAMAMLCGWFWAARDDRNILAAALLILAFAGSQAILIVGLWV